ncbi:hypothetical protein [Paragemmobacter straminiformis]|uniref:5-carboxymethyl-2-hydroxymuconate isomerase n=1 Tax=Paragemmobacter straminiformis TaxID=2045119 RepID=A0A842IB36_9RHOB|nr:hypothetical protein [Gemmobacter straminiformis]MBC2836885.1 hypothetical protein [Gemmobacter straminiformis]
MPNLKIFVDDTLYPACRPMLVAALGPIRDMLCADLQVDIPACQFAVMPVAALPDLPRVNVEMAILPRPERTRELILSVCAKLRGMVEEATKTHVAVRVTSLDPATYIALK